MGIKKTVSLLSLTSLGLLVFIFFISSCSSEKTKLHLYYYKQELNGPMDELTTAFSLHHPDIEIETEMFPDYSINILMGRFASGNAPDIIQLQGYRQVTSFAHRGYLLDLSEEPVISKTREEWREAVIYDDKIFALPMDYNGLGIIYNKKLFAEYDLSPPATFSDLKILCLKLKSLDIIPFAGTLKANWSAGHFLTMLHASLTGSNVKIKEWIKEMDEGKASWADTVDKDLLFSIMDFYIQNLDPRSVDMNWREQQEVFANGETAMMFQGLWNLKPLMEINPQMDCGFIPFPVGENPEDQKFFADVDSSFAISKDSKKKKAAKKFLNWLCSDEAIDIWIKRCGLVPSFKNADLSPLPKPFKVLIDHVEKKGAYIWEFCYYPISVYNVAAKNEALGYLLEQKNADDVITALDESWRVQW